MRRLILPFTGDTAAPDRTRILVTGAAIGRVRASPDTAIGLHTRRNCDGVEAVAAELRLKGAQSTVAPGDLAERDTAEGLIAATVARLGGLDVLISNAGFADRTPISSPSDAAIRASVAAIQGAFFRLARAASARRREPARGRGRHPRCAYVSYGYRGVSGIRSGGGGTRGAGAYARD